MEPAEIVIRIAENEADFTACKSLILEYVDWLGIDLSFQNFSDEIHALRDMYSAPAGGLLLATAGSEPAGVAGVRRLDDKNGELKRMYVRPAFRRLGLGKILLQQSIALARQLGYEKIKLDTSDDMKDAIKLYVTNGFTEIPAYRYNPHVTARYFELKL